MERNQDTIAQGFNMLRSAYKAGTKFTGFMRDNTTAQDYSVAEGVADMLVAKLPQVKGEDGKDENAQERNNMVRTIRRALGIVGKERGQKLTIKRIEGSHVVSITALGAKGADEGEGEPDSEGDTAEGQTQHDPLAEALALVLENLDKPEVLTAIRAGLTKLAGL